MAEYRPRFEGVGKEESGADYRSLCASAMMSLVAGLLSPLIFMSPIWVSVAVLAVVLGWISLGQIRRSEGTLTGRGLAWVGTGVAIFCMAAAPTEWFVHRRFVRAEAPQFTASVLEALHREDVGEYYRLMRDPFGASRGTRGSVSIMDLVAGQFSREDLSSTLQQDTVMVLLNLRGKWNYALYDTEYQTTDPKNNDVITQSYAINWDNHGDFQTFFVNVTATRMESVPYGLAGWKFDRIEGNITPKAMGGTRKSE